MSRKNQQKGGSQQRYFKSDTASAFNGDSNTAFANVSFGSGLDQNSSSGFGSFGGQTSFGGNSFGETSFGGNSFATQGSFSQSGFGESGFVKYSQQESGFSQFAQQPKETSGFGAFGSQDTNTQSSGFGSFQSNTGNSGFGGFGGQDTQSTGFESKTTFGSSPFGGSQQTTSFGDTTSFGSSSFSQTPTSSVFGSTFSAPVSFNKESSSQKEDTGSLFGGKPKPKQSITDLTKKPTIIETKGIIKIFYELNIKDKEKCEKFLKKEHTKEDLEAFEKPSFELGKIPEIDPGNKGKKPQDRFLNDIGAMIRHENPRMSTEEVRKIVEEKYHNLDLETKRKYELDV